MAVYSEITIGVTPSRLREVADLLEKNFAEEGIAGVAVYDLYDPNTVVILKYTDKVIELPIRTEYV